MCPGHHSSKTLDQRLPSGPLTETRERNDSLVQAAARAYPTWRWFSSAGFGGCLKCVFEITDLVHQPLPMPFWAVIISPVAISRTLGSSKERLSVTTATKLSKISLINSWNFADSRSVGLR